MRLGFGAAITALALSAALSASSQPKPATSPSLDRCRSSNDGKSVVAAVREGDCLRDANLFKEAIDAYKRGLVIDVKGSKDLFLGLSAAYLETRKLDAALQAAFSADHLSPSDPTVLVEVGMAYEELGDYDEALSYFRQTVALRPSDGRAMRNIGFVLLQQDHLDDAVDALLKALEINPSDWKAHQNLSVAYSEIYTSGRNKVQALTMSMPNGGPASAPAFVERDAIVKKLNSTNYVAKSIEHAREAARLNPDDYRTWYALARRYADSPKGGYGEAIEAYKRAIAVKPDAYPVLHDLAIAQRRNGSYAEAYQTCDQLERYHGVDRDISWMRGDLDLATRRYEDAVKNFGAALAVDERTADLHFGLARAYRKMGRTDEFQRELDRAKELRPDRAKEFDFIVEHD